MTKKFYSVFNWLLSSLIVLLGFGSCKTTKKVEKEGTTTESVDQGQAADSVQQKKLRGGEIRLLYGPKPPRKEIRVLYGPPPTTKSE